MSVPEGKEIGYECVNGHVNEEHKSKRVSADRGSSTNNLIPSCIECGGRLRRTLIPLLECQDCGNVWPYAGDADRPTCSNCRGKRTRPANAE